MSSPVNSPKRLLSIEKLDSIELRIWEGVPLFLLWPVNPLKVDITNIEIKGKPKPRRFLKPLVDNLYQALLLEQDLLAEPL